MATKVIQLKDLARELKGASRATLQQQRAIVTDALARQIPVLVAESPVDTGLYAQSWGFTVDEHKAVLGNYAPHAPIIEYGARPFTPPIGPLLAWAKRVLKDPSQPPDYSPAVQRLARGTQAKIARQGIKPHHIMEKAIPKILENIRKEFAKLG